LYVDGAEEALVAPGPAGSDTISQLCLSGRLSILARWTTDFFGFFAMYAPHTLTAGAYAKSAQASSIFGG
jgi:hypothetical protein